MISTELRTRARGAFVPARCDSRRRIGPGLGLSVLVVGGVLAACTTSFNINERPRRDSGRDVLADAIDVTSDVAATETGDVADDGPALDAADVPSDSDAGCGTCPVGRECCGSNCVNTNNDRSHCGGCGMACPGTVCSSGTCTSVCALGFLDCDRNAVNGCEVDAARDVLNCGACGIACPDGRACEMGRCACPPGFADCDGNPANGCEVDIATDSTRCGDCRTRCGASMTCATGRCACATGFADCDRTPANGCEVDTRTSNANCGACGTVCGTNSTCVDGMCRCDMGFLRCPPSASGCTVSATDAMNCTACGTACTGGTPVCGPTGCVSGCAPGETLCGASCVDLQTDATRCGSCTTACPARPNASARCDMGVCRSACDSGFADCDTNAANGCEVDLRVANANCGGCGNVCPGAQTCVAGSCTCPTGQRHCGGGVCAECCEDSQCSDGDGCTADRCMSGTCVRSPCADRSLVCCGSTCRACCSDSDCPMALGRGCGVDGTCSVCLSGRADCDANTANGCETDTATSLMHCGACSNACSFAHAAASCTAGRCALGTCDPGYADCDANPLNGCEVELSEAVNHCGRCGNVCSFPGSGAACRMGTCVMTSCAPGRGDCDGVAMNGCETDLTNSVTDCGSCGTSCAYPNASAMCSAGVCGLGTCAAGFASCDGNAANGCEVNLQTAVGHCGACMNMCMAPNATSVCTMGVCGLGGCLAGFGNCDAMGANGCETNTQTSTSHCGTCGVACMSRPNAATTCTGGSCGFSCNTGWGDCDSAAANGCELNCGAARTCASGACQSGWLAMSSSPIVGRAHMFFAVAPGRHEFYVWGGQNAAVTPTYFSDGARYNWDTNTWTMLPASPLSARSLGVGVWTGQEFFVWGGRNATTTFNDGALYNPATNTWRTVAATGGMPSSRSGYHGYWTGTEVLVFGGEDLGTIRADGGLFNPATNAWRAIPSRPVARTREASVWNGTEFLIWGGTTDCSGGDNTGHAFAPGGAWSTMQNTNRPSARWFTPLVFCTRAAWQTAWIPGTREMFVWGGPRGSLSYSNDGRRYRRSSDTWFTVSAAPAAITSGAFLPVLVGAGSRVIGWSPVGWSGTANTPTNVVFVYDAGTDTWTTSTPAGAPTPVTSGAAYGWTGVELIVWGGRTGTTTVSNVGGRLVVP